jgi:tetratricopeptide (TPR) repeat protein
MLSFISRADRGQDSMRNVINTDPRDSIKVIAYTYLGFYCINEPEKVLDIISEMQNYVPKIEQDHIKALGYRKIGVLYNRLNYFDKGIEYTLQAATLFEKVKELL